MRVGIFIIFTLVVVSCQSSPDRKSSQSTERKEVNTTDTITSKINQKAQKFEELTTENAIPFLYEYEKKNKERKVRIITRYGNIDIELFEQTPYHRANFIFLVKQKYFDGTFFHRVVNHFVIQGGNSDSWETSRKRRRIGKYLLPPDTKKGFRHHRGIVSMPSSDIDNPHQFASPYEFFIVVQKPGAYHLDGKYTAFGKVISGMDVVDKISAVPTDERDWPIENIEMQVQLLD